MRYKQLIAYLGQKKNKEFNDEIGKLMKVTGFKNYTHDYLAKMSELFREGKISVRPGFHSGDAIGWYDTDNKLHRDGDLPALESKQGVLEYYTHGKHDRADGPSRIKSPVSGYPVAFIEWYKNGVPVASMSLDDKGNEKCNIGPHLTSYVALDKYCEYILDNFPQAGGKTLVQDWIA